MEIRNEHVRGRPQVEHKVREARLTQTCAEEGEWTYWTYDVEHGAPRQEGLIKKKNIADNFENKVKNVF